MSLHVKKVISNIKGGVSTELGHRTLIVGPNGSGKSAIVNSIEYALTAAVSDVIGRGVVKDVNALLPLGPGDKLNALVELSDGQKVSCETVGKKSSSALFPQAFPLRDVQDALAGSIETVRKFFLQMVSGSISIEEIRKNAIPGPLQELFEAAISGAPSSTPGVDLLLRAIETSKKHARDLTSQAEVAQGLISTMTQGVAPTSPQDLNQLKEQLQLCRNSVSELSVQLSKEHEHAALLSRADSLAGQISALREQLDLIPAPAEADTVRENLYVLLHYAGKNGLTVCPACRRELDGEFAHEIAEDVAFWVGRKASIEAKRTSRAAELQEHTRISFELKSLEAQQRVTESQLSAYSESVEQNTTEDIEEALDTIKTDERVLTEQIISAERASEAWEQARRQRDQAVNLRSQAKDWGLLTIALKTAIGELLDRSVSTFCAKVQTYLPKSDRFHLELHDGDREVCRYGFLRGPMALSHELVLHTALSGAEWARLTVALAAATVKDGGDNQLQILIPSDRSWDPETLAGVLVALDLAPAQVIVATTTMPTRIPQNWTVIETGPFLTIDDFTPKHPVVIARQHEQAESIEQGDYIALGQCKHGRKHDYCAACAMERKKAEKAKVKKAGAKKALEEKGAPKELEEEPEVKSNRPVSELD